MAFLLVSKFMKHSTMSITSYSCKCENLYLINIRVVVILYDGLLAQITVSPPNADGICYM